MKINKKPPVIPPNPVPSTLVKSYVLAGIASGNEGSLMGVFGASEFSHGVKGLCKDNEVAGVLGQNDYPRGIGVSGTADNGIGVHGFGGQLAGKFEGNVEITGNLIVQGQDVSIHHLMQRARELEQKVQQLEVATTRLTCGYQVTRTQSGLRLTNQNGEEKKSTIPANKITPEQQDQVLNVMVESLVEFFRVNEDAIRDGRIKAADIGGFVYGVAAAAVLILFAPLAGAELLVRILKLKNITFTGLAVETGRFYGAIVDDFVLVLKSQGEQAISEVVGTLATLYFFEKSGAVHLLGTLGTDGWSLTKKIGERIGGTATDALQTIESVASYIWNPIGNAAENAEKFVEKFIPW